MSYWSRPEIDATRWKDGDWLVVGTETVDRGDAPGWRFSGGILVFGGWDSSREEDKRSVILIDNDFIHQGEAKARIKLEKLSTII